METHIPKILFLGASYTDIRPYLQAIDPIVSCGQNRTLELDRVIACVEYNHISEIDGRDLSRIVETERECNVDVYTVSLAEAAKYKESRHYSGNFNNHRFVSSLRRHFVNAAFDQVTLDYYWQPNSAMREHMRPEFFSKTLPELAIHMLSPHACVYLPFCVHTLKETLIHKAVLSRHYTVTYLPESELAEVFIWRGTQAIDGDIMQEVFGKNKSQEDKYCKISKQAIRQDDEYPELSNKDVIHFCQTIGDLKSVRFIKLERHDTDRT